MRRISLATIQRPGIGRLPTMSVALWRFRGCEDNGLVEQNVPILCRQAPQNRYN
jgi:hypothetical protein